MYNDVLRAIYLEHINLVLLIPEIMYFIAIAVSFFFCHLVLIQPNKDRNHTSKPWLFLHSLWLRARHVITPVYVRSLFNQHSSLCKNHELSILQLNEKRCLWCLTFPCLIIKRSNLTTNTKSLQTISPSLLEENYFEWVFTAREATEHCYI